MLKEFTDVMIEEFNAKMNDEQSIIRLYLREDQTVDIKLSQDKYLKSEDQIINPTKEFYKELETFFKQKGYKIRYNNTWSCFWAGYLTE